MARDKVTYESYEQDVFDNPPKGPVGVHRGSRPVMARIAPFLIVILVAALCGVGAWAGITGEYRNILNLGSSQTASSTADKSTKSDSSSSSDSSTKSDTSSKSDSTAKSDSSADGSSDANSSDTTDGSSDTSDQNAQQAEPQATVNQATQVRVVNATGLGGYAGQKADVLKTSGYTNVEAANPSGGSLPSYTVVWYENETDKATADDVAAKLGITAVEQVQGLSAPITVVLLN